jgi:TolB-like protein/DNA-binding winged helix-turn-helix (wHTH) protein/Flp pilus assembly protein TadD
MVTDSSDSVDPSASHFQLADWLVRPDQGTVTRGGETVRLEPRVMDVLAYLAQQPGRTATKEELLDVVWEGMVVEEGALPQCIHAIRKSLGDDARSPRYIQTIPKRGYRLVAEVSRPAAGESAPPAPPPLASPAELKKARSWRLAAVIAAVAVAATLSGALLLDRRQEQSLAGGPPRIVVLPFENLGPPTAAVFAEGMTEEITANLACLSTLRVISRTSARTYSRGDKTVRQIAEELDVDYVLEGTVRWAKDGAGRQRVRITPQLIRVADDSHVWAEVFEREVGDVFALQAEISERVINMLGITLLAPERRQLRVPVTANMAAYQAYLRGLELIDQPFFSPSHVEAAIGAFERAAALDPGFAQAWAQLSQAHSYLCFNAVTPEQVALHCGAGDGKRPSPAEALARARATGPRLPEVLLAEAFHAYRVDRDYAAALDRFRAAAKTRPSDATARWGTGLVLRRQGNLAEAVTLFKEAASLDPRSIKRVWAVAETYSALRAHAKADNVYDQAISLAPDQPLYWEEKASNRLAWDGDLAVARAILDDAPANVQDDLAGARVELDLVGGRLRAGVEGWSRLDLASLPVADRYRLAWRVAVALDLLGDRDAGRALAERNRQELARQVAPCAPGEGRRAPGSSALLDAYLGIALAQLGRREEAVCHGDRAVASKEDDRFSGPRMVEARAVADLLLGDREAARRRLRSLLGTTYQQPITPALLRCDPLWAPVATELKNGG